MPPPIPRLAAPFIIALTSLLSAVAPCFSQDPQTPASPTAKTERWKGVIELPASQKLHFSVTLSATPDGAAGTITIPAQGLSQGPLSAVAFDGAARRFTLAFPGAPDSAAAVFNLTVADDGTASGTLNQHGMAFKVTMSPADEAEDLGLRRPQTPTPPFPYKQREVTYTNPADGALLAGTLTFPSDPGPHPAVVLITGSGPQDRDETIFGHKPFWVIADHLSRAGIAVLRADDRGVGGSTSPKNGEETTLDFAADAGAAVEFLARQPEIDPRRIGLLGHSEGAIAAVIAASRRPVALVVMLAGPAVPGRDILVEQMAAVLRAAGTPEDKIAEVQRAQVRLLDLIIADAPRDELIDAARALLRAQLGGVGGAGGGDADADPEAAAREDEMAAATVTVATSPWMRSFLTLDPREYLRRIDCPFIAYYGELDAQVPARQNLPELIKALETAPTTFHAASTLPNLNHLFQTAKTGGVDEYAQIEETISPILLEDLSRRLRSQFGITR